MADLVEHCFADGAAARVPASYIEFVVGSPFNTGVTPHPLSEVSSHEGAHSMSTRSPSHSVSVQHSFHP